MTVSGDLALVTEWLVGQGGKGRDTETSSDTAEAGSWEPGAGVWDGAPGGAITQGDKLRCHGLDCLLKWGMLEEEVWGKEEADQTC